MSSALTGVKIEYGICGMVALRGKMVGVWWSRHLIEGWLNGVRLVVVSNGEVQT